VLSALHLAFDRRFIPPARQTRGPQELQFAPIASDVAAGGQSNQRGAMYVVYAFCRQPVYVLVGAGLAALWGVFVSVR